ncbi:group II intron maturase-specific domain-containing protein [Pseudomonas fluorescens]|uniref:Group II intron maturase-specific domain-containing protein n=1 Tax=Pseudomonas fluorescens TaxID=294 RepID=A0A5E7AM12_PSEFL|nr:group II intron maturase-specific domain-containing protein [Pseudomonas fluorescens]VVN80146.1 hypothetical protein PS723_01022 [Pseudomonas fluorescens]
MTLDGLEAMLAKKFPYAKWTARKMRVVRYADDLIISGCSKGWLEFLRGWANYHSHVVAKKVFNQVDSEVWTMLWRQAVRRRPRTGYADRAAQDQGRRLSA